MNIARKVRIALNSGEDHDAIRKTIHDAVDAEIEEALAAWVRLVDEGATVTAEIEAEIEDAVNGPSDDKLYRGTRIHRRIFLARRKFGPSEGLTECMRQVLLELFELTPDQVAEQLAKQAAEDTGVQP